MVIMSFFNKTGDGEWGGGVGKDKKLLATGRAARARAWEKVGVWKHRAPGSLSNFQGLLGTSLCQLTFDPLMKLLI